MAKKKEVIVDRIDLGNGYIKLKGTRKDTRTNNTYSEVVCKPEEEKYFIKEEE